MISSREPDTKPKVPRGVKIYPAGQRLVTTAAKGMKQNVESWDNPNLHESTGGN